MRGMLGVGSRRQHDTMKQTNLIRLSQQYVAALERHLKRGPGAGWQSALKLGRAAVALKLDTLELARIHEQALAALGLANVKNAFTKLAGIFFSEANALIEETHRAAQEGRAHLSRTQVALGVRTEELAVSKRELRRGVAQRKVMTDAAVKNGKHHDRSLEESLQLQKRLRELTHRALTTQEHERTHISHELQDEIAQTLLGINVRLLSLKQQSHSDTNGLKREITSAQRLVLKSARSVRRFARELRTQPRLPASRSLVKKSSPERRSKISTRIAPPAALVSPTGFPVIAMAASVGGLKALSVILGGLPADFPAAIAIVMHISPDHKSLLAEILARRTQLTVKQAHTGDQLCRSCAFIAPPNHHLLVGKNGRLKLSSADAEKIHFARPSAEPLFASVAKIYQKKAVAVVLTGGDGDGSFGVQIIKENGGTVIAQDRPTSENFSMPETSIKTGDVDYVLPLEE
ncbi:MAG: hypothetical protein RL616_2322, partial [Verrucomicrobiota bacterium]